MKLDTSDSITLELPPPPPASGGAMKLDTSDSITLELPPPPPASGGRLRGCLRGETEGGGSLEMRDADVLTSGFQPHS
jgi:hypothetical protein